MPNIQRLVLASSYLKQRTDSEWIKSNEMKKSDPVQIELLEDGNLKICPAPKSDQGYQVTGALTTTSKEKCQQ